MPWPDVLKIIPSIPKLEATDPELHDVYYVGQLLDDCCLGQSVCMRRAQALGARIQSLGGAHAADTATKHVMPKAMAHG